jgi:hypothetical protein
MSSQNSSDRNFDLRTLEYLLARGSITQKEYESFLNHLPDDEGNYQTVEIQEEESKETVETGETVSLD